MESTELHKKNKLWLLIELESNNGTNIYNVINSSDIVVIHGQTLDVMSTGKLIYVRNGNQIVQATIVTISDDKNYVDTELRHLRQMSMENLNQSNNFNDIKQESGKKRKRASEASNGNSNKKSTSSQSSSSGTDDSQRPMMFDQYCQTDFKSNNDSIGQSQQFDKLFSIQNSILEEQKRTGNESKGVQDFVVSLMEQVEQLKQIVTDMNKKIDTINDKSGEGVIIYDNKSSRRSLASLNNSSSNLTIETYEVNHDNSQLNESNFSNNSIKCADDFTFKNLNRTISTHSLNSSVSQNNSNNLVIDQIKNDWGEDDEENSGENAKIGTFKTEVPKHILRSINWKSHTGATRKLLMALFSRKILATHSLTGKPSPGNFFYPNFYNNVRSSN